MIYNVRLREVLVHDFQVESEDLKGAFLVALKKAHSKKLKNQPVGRFFELEYINKGMKNDSNPKTCIPGKRTKIKNRTL